MKILKICRNYFSKNKILIEECLNKEYSPDLLKLVDISSGHGEPHDSHFQLYIVSDKFDNLKTLQRHRNIIKILKDASIMNNIHAITINAKTIEEHMQN